MRRTLVALLFVAVCPSARLSAVQCPDGSPPPCRAPAPARVPLDSNALAILPFRVSGPPEAQYLGQGMMDLLSIALDSVAGWRVLHPRTVFGTAAARTDFADPGAATRLARGIGAGGVVIASVVAVGPDLRVQAELYDVARRRRVATVRARGNLDRPAPVADSIAGGLARPRLVAMSGAGRRSLQEYTTTSPAALQAYLAAEQLARRAEWQAALDSLQNAIARDPSFGLAYYRLYLVRFYGGNLRGIPVADVRRAMGHLDRVPPRQRDLLRLAHAQLSGLRAEALERAAAVEARYPDDAEAQMEVGETYFHHGILAGMSPERAVRPLERAIGLDSAFVEPYLHAIELLCLAGDTARAWARMRAFRAVASDYFFARALELALRISFRAEDPASLAVADLSDGLVASEIIRVLDRAPARAVVLADSVEALVSAPQRPSADRPWALTRRHLLLLAQGRYAAAWEALQTAAAIDPSDKEVLHATVLHAAVTGRRQQEAGTAATLLPEQAEVVAHRVVRRRAARLRSAGFGRR